MSSSSIDMKIRHFDMLIDGEMVSSSDDGYFESVNPSTGEVFATVTNATADDLEKAVSAAKAAHKKGTWRNFSLPERGIYFKKIAGLIRENAKELADLETKDTGKTAKQTTFIDVPTSADTFEHFSNLEGQLEPRENRVDAPVRSETHFEPMGAVACIIPWNYPLIMAAWKMAPALMAGNTVILKPSPKGAVSLMRLAQIIQDSGLPKGTVNIVSTDKVDVSQRLVEHPDINMVSFTGGTETGKNVMKTASETVKKVSLELGGKSPSIVFADCDKEAALGGTLSSIFMNQGQMCTAASRLFIEEKIYDEFLSRLVERTKALKIGNAADYETQFGPVINEDHRDNLLRHIEQAVEAGAKIECGGKIPEGQLYQKGYYIEPTILSHITPEMAIFQEEVFGPVLTVMKFETLDEAVKLANETKFGLAACVWTTDKSKPAIMAEALQCGTIWVNTYGGFYNEASFGGYKQSGFGRELGVEGLLEYTQTKNVCIDQTPGGKSLVTSWY